MSRSTVRHRSCRAPPIDGTVAPARHSRHAWGAACPRVGWLPCSSRDRSAAGDDGGAARWRRAVDVVAVRTGDLPCREAGELLVAASRAAVTVRGRVTRCRYGRTYERHDRRRSGCIDVDEPVPTSSAPDPARPAAFPAGRETLVHGDFHSAQLGRTTGGGCSSTSTTWACWTPRGTEPAGFWTAGRSIDADWRAFLDAVPALAARARQRIRRAAGRRCEPFARAAVIAAAANHPDDDCWSRVADG